MLRSLLALLAILTLASCASIKSAQEHNTEGLHYLQNGRYLQAETEFAVAAKLDPNSAVFKNNLGVAYLRQGRYGDAANQLQEAIKLDDTKAFYFKNLGDAFLGQGQLDSALSQYQRALSINPAEVGAHRGIILIAFDMGTTDRYIKEFDDAARSAKPDDARGVDLVFLLEQAILQGYILQGKYEEVISRATVDIDAIRGVKTEKDRYVMPIITPFFYWIHTMPKTRMNLSGITASLYNFRGRAYLGKGMLNDAISDLKHSNKNAPNGFGDLYLGIVYLRAGNSHKAVYQLGKFLDAHPDSSIARLYYVAALKVDGDLKAAEEQLTKARKSAERIVQTGLKHEYESFEALAYVNQLWGRHDVAIKMYKRVLVACPSCGWSDRNLGEIYLGLGRKAEALYYLSRAAALLPADQRTKELLHGL